MALLVGLLVPAASGCSFVSTQGPPPHYQRMQDFDCTRRYTAPIVDTANVVVGAAMTFLFYGLAEGFSQFSAIAPPNARDTRSLYGAATGSPLYASSDPRGVLLLAIPLAGLPAASAVYGYSNVASCREAKAELAARQAAAGAEPPAEP